MKHAQHPVARMALLAFLVAGVAQAQTWEGAFPEGVEEFRILFVSSEAIHPVATNITWFDDFVSGLADAVPELAALSTTWRCLGSTAAVSAKGHTDTDPVANGAGVPIYRTDGTLFASNNAALWSPGVGAELDPFYNEWGVCEYYFAATGGDEQFGYVWTGTMQDGSSSTNPIGSTEVTKGKYIGPYWFTSSPSEPFPWPTNGIASPVYGISEVVQAADIPPPGGSEPEVFIARLRAPWDTAITDFSVDGLLTWSNATVGSICTVEVANAFGESNAEWSVYTAVRTSNSTTVVRMRDPGVPENMVLIPAGTFDMGDSLDEGSRFELPVHVVTVSEFWMDRSETSNDDMVSLLNWANGEGRISIDGITVSSTVGQSQDLLIMHDWYSRIAYNGTNFYVREPNGSGHPVINVTWWGAINYCNWRSELGGLEPCYNLSDASCTWSNSGYRLPTEAEWERAARGGLAGARFPSGSTINHSHGNYYGSGVEGSYDEAPAGYHPDYDTYVSWWPPVPLTAPVTRLAMNGYRLYHMAGNVQEWCWDKNGVQANDPYRYYYDLGPELDPRGADGPAYLTRIYRGGAWNAGAARCSYWGHGPWQRYNEDLGFRVVRRRLLLE